MEIRSDRSVEYIAKPGNSALRALFKRETESTSLFGNAKALEERLGLEPDVRPGVVERAKALVAAKDYPPVETINKIATLLAVNLEGEEIDGQA